MWGWLLVVVLVVLPAVWREQAAAADARRASGEPEQLQEPGVESAGAARRRPGSLVWGVLRRIAVIVAAVYLGLSLYMFLFQARFLYYPSRAVPFTPSVLNLAYEDVRVPVGEGADVHGWFVPAAAGEDRGAVLFCHGNAGTIADRLDTLEILHELGFAVMLFDYRGYGNSAGRPSERGTYDDARAAWRHLTEQRGFAPAKIVVFGRSLGGAVAARLAQETAPAALVVESSFSSVPDLARELYPFLPVGWLCRFRYSTAEYAAAASCPVVVVHSPGDELIPFTHGRRIFNAATAPKHFLQIRGSHNEGFLVSGSDYTDGLDKALGEYLPRGR